MDQAHRQVSCGKRWQLALLLLASVGSAACSGDADSEQLAADGAAGSAGAPADSPPEYPADLPYARSVERFTPGAGAGYGRERLPAVVLGPPSGKGLNAGSLDVLSLGLGGEIVLGFGEQTLRDGAGPDFVVFENAFWPGGVAAQVYAELAEVSVSEDGETWRTFECDTTGDGQGHFPGCAGASPTLRYDPVSLVPLDPALAGGDSFDLAEVGLVSARYVKLRDLATLPGEAPSVGFDLDAVGICAEP